MKLEFGRRVKLLISVFTYLQVVLPTPPFPPTKIHLRDFWSMILTSEGSNSSMFNVYKVTTKSPREIINFERPCSLGVSKTYGCPLSKTAVLVSTAKLLFFDKS